MGYIHNMDWKPFIHTDASICGGRPVIKGTRITVEMILEDLAHGGTVDGILISYPHLPKEAVPASLAFASEMIRSEAFHLDA
jgi:uncharacterized protein (DUF433 family)